MEMLKTVHLSSMWYSGTMRKESLSLLPSTSQLLAYLAVLCLTTWKSFWGEHDWSKMMMEGSENQGSSDKCEKNIFVPCIYIFKYKVIFPEALAENCSQWHDRVLIPGALLHAHGHVYTTWAAQWARYWTSAACQEASSRAGKH